MWDPMPNFMEQPITRFMQQPVICWVVGFPRVRQLRDQTNVMKVDNTQSYLRAGLLYMGHHIKTNHRQAKHYNVQMGGCKALKFDHFPSLTFIFLIA